jgi:hypothetical protein
MACGGGVLGGGVLGGGVLGGARGPALPVPAGPARPAPGTVRGGSGAGVPGPCRCRCGHDAAAHEHFRPGTDCGACGARGCAHFRAVRGPGPRGARGR